MDIDINYATGRGIWLHRENVHLWQEHDIHDYSTPVQGHPLVRPGTNPGIAGHEESSRVRQSIAEAVGRHVQVSGRSQILLS
jgi:hypothetical protein